MQQASERQIFPASADVPGEGERLAVWTLRRAGGHYRPCHSSNLVAPAPLEKELAGVSAMFRALFVQQNGIRAVQLGMSCCLNMTKDERRLLNAVAAMQAGEEALLDNYLYRLALDRTARRPLAEAVTRLAACLAVHGYWLARPCAAPPVTGAALTVARMQGGDMRDVRVTWP